MQFNINCWHVICMVDKKVLETISELRENLIIAETNLSISERALVEARQMIVILKKKIRELEELI